MSASAPLSSLDPDNGQPAWRQILALFERHGLQPPPTRLRDELVVHLAWARHGEQLERLAAAEESKPIPMILFCPSCGQQHIDEAELPYIPDNPSAGEAERNRAATWTNPPHRSHLCRPDRGGCGHIWRPADVPTEGVASIQTMGKADSPRPIQADPQTRAIPMTNPPNTRLAESVADRLKQRARRIGQRGLYDAEGTRSDLDQASALLRELTADNSAAMREASALALWLHKNFYAEVTQFTLCDSPAGVLTQIDNMVAGLAETITAKDALLREQDERIEEAHEIGKRDGYESAVQDIDLMTGGDGEYRFCSDHDPDRHTPDAATMKARIADRFAAKDERIAKLEGERTSAEHFQREGRDADIIREALNEYDQWMLDDDFDAMPVLRQIIDRMRHRFEMVERPARSSLASKEGGSAARAQGPAS